MILEDYTELAGYEFDRHGAQGAVEKCRAILRKLPGLRKLQLLFHRPTGTLTDSTFYKIPGNVFVMTAHLYDLQAHLHDWLQTFSDDPNVAVHQDLEDPRELLNVTMTMKKPFMKGRKGTLRGA